MFVFVLSAEETSNKSAIKHLARSQLGCCFFSVQLPFSIAAYLGLTTG